jgi:hypothetical protein
VGVVYLSDKVVQWTLPAFWFNIESLKASFDHLPVMQLVTKARLKPYNYTLALWLSTHKKLKNGREFKLTLGL